MVNWVLIQLFFLSQDWLEFWSLNITADYPVESLTPCLPNPCGANAVCRDQNGVGSCQCQSEYFGNPYEGCRPECIVSSDCPSNRACVRNKCQDPCPGVCSPNADCLVTNHIPSCTCKPGYTGNPYTYCTFIQNERKCIAFKGWQWSNRIIIWKLNNFSFWLSTIPTSFF